MARNVMKHTIHNWGSNILSINEGLGPPNSMSQPKKIIFRENIICLEYLAQKCKINIKFFSSFFGGENFKVEKGALDSVEVDTVPQ